MKKRIQIVAGTAVLMSSWGLAGVVFADTPFAAASVRFEQNATDGDVEVVFEVKAGDLGLKKLIVTSPDGRTVVDFTAPDASTLGIRQFRFESPEPADAAGLKAAYPQGVYEFTGTDAAGERFDGKSSLNHTLPATASLRQPMAEAEGVDPKDLNITWNPGKDLAAYIVEIEQDDLGVNVTATLPGSVSMFAVPNGFLNPGVEYDLAIGTVSNDGNISFVETSFTTAE